MTEPKPIPPSGTRLRALLSGRRLALPRFLAVLASFLALGLACALLTLSSATGGLPTPSRPSARLAADSTVPGSWRLFFTGDTRGYLDPCGCERGQFGGVARRGTFLVENRREGDLLLDLGNLVVGTRPLDRIRLTFVIEALRALRYDALVPGEGELALGADFETAARKLERPRVICANLLRTDTQEPPFPPYLVHALADGTRVAVIGLTSPYQRLPSCYRVLPPVEALKAAMDSLPAEIRTFVVAGFLDGQVALDLAREFPDVALVAGAKVPSASNGVLRRGGAPVVLGGERGQYVTAIEVDTKGFVIGAQPVWLDESVRDDPALAELVCAHDREASRLGDTFVKEAVAAFAAEGRVGSSACRECHAQTYATWSASKHAHAVEVLKTKNQQRNPNCLECHFQEPLAEEHPSGLLPGIGCESCHGGGAEHIRVARAHPTGVPARMLTSAGESGCMKCHDLENSRNFEFRTYWPRIQHGKG